MQILGPTPLGYARPDPLAASRASWKYYGFSGALTVLAFALVPAVLYAMLEWRLSAWPLLIVSVVDWVGALAVAIAGLRRGVRPRAAGVVCVLASAVGLTLFLAWVLVIIALG